MKRVLLAASVGVLAVVAAVLFSIFRPDPPLPPAQSKLLDPGGNFVLYVSNQSFYIDPVDIQIWIDGECVVREYFEVGNQHNYRPFVLRLSEGTHCTDQATCPEPSTCQMRIPSTPNGS